jgi:hypothetical protein
MSKESFLKVYANLPINIRREIVLVLDKEGPITWEVAYLEISNNTKLGDIILKKLSEMKVI